MSAELRVMAKPAQAHSLSRAGSGASNSTTPRSLVDGDHQFSGAGGAARTEGQFSEALDSFEQCARDSANGARIVARSHASERPWEIPTVLRCWSGDRTQPEPVGMRDLLERARSSDVLILDARPANEYLAGHIAGAVSVPIDDLQNRLRSLPMDKEYVAYCRGPYCVYADRAVELLRKSRRRARRLAEGFPEWRAAGFPIEQGDAPARPRQMSAGRTRMRRRPSA